MSVVYIKTYYYENGIVFSKQKECTVTNRDEHDNVTVNYYNNETKQYETRVLNKTQYSEDPYLMDFE